MTNSALERNIHPADEMMPVPKLFALGLQHVMLMYAGAIAIPLIVGGAANLSKDQVAALISADLFVSGIVSIIQSMGIWRFGVRLPVMMGVSFAAVPAMLVIANDPALGIRGIFGAVIGSGIVVLLLAPFIGKLIRFFPPVVVGSVITVTGVLLMPTAINWSAGGQPMLTVVEEGVRNQVPNPDYGAPGFLVISGFVVLVTLVSVRFFRGFAANIGVLLGLGAGFALALLLGRVNLDTVGDAAWVGVVMPFHFGLPIFDGGAVLTMSIVMIVIMVETAGILLAVGEMVGRPVDNKAMTAGLRADGLGTIIGGVFNTFPYISYTTNIGLLGTTGVKSRWVCVAGGVILIVLGLAPKFAAVAASIPVYVMGGALIVIFGMVCAVGVKILAAVNFSERGNLYIVGFSLVMGLIPVLAPRFYERVPAFLDPLTHSGITTAAITAFLLNLYFFHLPVRLSEMRGALQNETQSTLPNA